MTQQLNVHEHSRDAAGLRYIYPVLSRRSGGVSIGINFNINNACNWRCIYCQVPDLQRGRAPEIDFQLLEEELAFFLDQVLSGRFYQQFNIPPQFRTIKDIAISGNGEPTSVPDFDLAIEAIGRIANEKRIFPKSHFVLISNGSLMHQVKVQSGLKKLNQFEGEVWFKLDSATKSGRQMINHCLENTEKVIEHLRISAALCQTKLQTCLVEYERFPWTDEERQAYLALLKRIKRHIKLEHIMLYSIARPSQQAEASQIYRVSVKAMQQFADEIEALGFVVSVNN